MRPINTSSIGLLYAVQPCDDTRHARVNRNTQSLAAESLLQRLSSELIDPIIASSKSHSRGMAAVVVATQCSQIIRLGIDIEYLDYRRPWRDMSAFLIRDIPLPSHVTISDFYRGWAFAEAYFKAFGAVPDAAYIHRIMCSSFNDQPHCLEPTLWLQQEFIGDDFALSVVWQGARQTPQRLCF